MILDDVIDLIAADGYGVRDSTLFKHLLPDAPDACVVVGEYGGRPGEEIFGEPGPAIEYPRVQVRVRGTAYDYDTPRALAERIYQGFGRRGGFTINTTRYLALTPLQPPYPLDRDAANRYVFAVNLEAWKEPELVESPHAASESTGVRSGPEGSEVV